MVDSQDLMHVPFHMVSCLYAYYYEYLYNKICKNFVLLRIDFLSWEFKNALAACSSVEMIITITSYTIYMNGRVATYVHILLIEQKTIIP